MQHEGTYLILEALVMVGILSGIPLLVSMSIGLVLSVLQAATQIQEQSLTFVPKVIGIAGAFVILGPWMLRRMLAFSHDVLQSSAPMSGLLP